MKKLNSILLIAATTSMLSFALPTNLMGDDTSIHMSKNPATKTISGNTPDMLDRSVKGGSPKGIEAQRSLASVSGKDVDMINRKSLALSPKQISNESANSRRFEVAPLK